MQPETISMGDELVRRRTKYEFTL